MRQPDPHRIRAIADELRAMIADDDEAFMDTLDGETDCIEWTDKAIARKQELDAMIAAIGEQQKALAERKARFTRQRDGLKGAILSVMEAMGLRKLERPAATLSIAKARKRVDVTDADALPSQLCQMVRKPDLRAIEAQLKAGETVPGAELKTGNETLTVRNT